MGKHSYYKEASERNKILHCRVSEQTLYDIESIMKWQNHKSTADCIATIVKHYRSIALCYQNPETARIKAVKNHSS